MKKFLIAVSVLLCLLITTPAEASSFKDVKSSDQFNPSIEWAVANGLLNGYEDGTFKPKNKLTEAQFAIILSRYLNPVLQNNIYPGLEREYVYEYLETYSLPFKGIEDNKSRNRGVTRIDVAKVFATLASGNRVSEKQAVDWMYEAEITKGKGVSQNKYKDFGGGDPLKREHIAAFIQRLDHSPLFTFPNMPRNIYQAAANLAPKPYKLIDIKKVNLTNSKSLSQYAALYKKPSKEHYEADYLVSVLTYDQNKKTWAVSFERKMNNYMDFKIDTISISEDPSVNQILAYALEGSGGYLSATVIGAGGQGYYAVEVPKVFYQGSYEVINGKLTFLEGPKPKLSYVWQNGKLVQAETAVIEPGKNDLIVVYDLDQYNNMYSNVRQHETLYAKVGQKLQFVQESAYLDDYTVRIMYSSITDIIDYTTGRFISDGLLDITIIPNGYDWEDALEFSIRVTK